MKTLKIQHKKSFFALWIALASSFALIVAALQTVPAYAASSDNNFSKVFPLETTNLTSNLHQNTQENSYVEYVAKPFGDSLVRVTLSNGSFRRTASGVEVLDKRGQVVDTISNELVTDTGGKAQLKFTLLGRRTLFIKYDVVENPVHSVEERGYWGCVGKNAIGGVIGGAAGGCAGGLLGGGVGCLPGAGIGAVSVGIGSTVGSLIWCW